MNPIVIAIRRPISTLLLAVVLVGGAVLGLANMQPGTQHHEVVVSTPKKADVTLDQRRDGQIHSQRHIDVCALQDGYLDEISVKGGQAVKKGDLMFKVKASAELDLTNIKAPFDGIVDGFHKQPGSLVLEGDTLTTLSDNSVMWAFFRVPENQYIECMAAWKQGRDDPKVELVLANGLKFSQSGKISAIDGEFNSETESIAFRADFANPEGVLRHGQVGTVLIHQDLHDVIVIPQRATHENLDARYVYIVDKDDVAHRREVAIRHEMDGIYVIRKGLDAGDRIVVEGTSLVHDGEKVSFESRALEESTGNPGNQTDKIGVAILSARDVSIIQPYVCQIHARRHINVCALQSGYLGEIAVKDARTVKRGDLLCKINRSRVPGKTNQTRGGSSAASARPPSGAMALAGSKVLIRGLNCTDVAAPFDGIVDRLHSQLGSLVKEGDVLTTLSDNSVMWVYFNLSENRYLECMATRKEDPENLKVELILANGDRFPQRGKIGAIEAQFDNETGSIAFRADFPNPDGLLRHGQTGTVLIHRTLHDATLIPMRAAHEVMDKWYVFVVGNNGVVHEREIVIENELDDIYVIKDGVGVDEKIVVDGTRQIHDGDKVDYEFRSPEEVMGNRTRQLK